MNNKYAALYVTCFIILLGLIGLWATVTIEPTTPLRTERINSVAIDTSLLAVPPQEVITSLLTSWYLFTAHRARLPWPVAEREPWSVMSKANHVQHMPYLSNISDHPTANPYVHPRWTAFFQQFVSRLAPRYIPPWHRRQSRKLSIESTCSAVLLANAPWCLSEASIAFVAEGEPAATYKRAEAIYNKSERGPAPINWIMWDQQQTLPPYQNTAAKDASDLAHVTIVAALRRAAYRPSVPTYLPGVHVCLTGLLPAGYDGGSNIISRLLGPVKAHRTHIVAFDKLEQTENDFALFIKSPLGSVSSTLLVLRYPTKAFPPNCHACESVYLRYALRHSLQKEAAVGIPVAWVLVSAMAHYFWAPVELFNVDSKFASIRTISHFNVSIAMEYRSEGHYQAGVSHSVTASLDSLVVEQDRSSTIDTSRLSDRVIFGGYPMIQRVLAQAEFILAYNPHWAVSRDEEDFRSEVLFGRFITRMLRPLLLLHPTEGTTVRPLKVLLFDFFASSVEGTNEERSLVLSQRPVAAKYTCSKDLCGADATAVRFVAHCAAYRFIATGNLTTTRDGMHGYVGKLDLIKVSASYCPVPLPFIQSKKSYQLLPDRTGFCFVDTEALAVAHTIKVFYSWSPPTLSPSGKWQLFDPSAT